MPTVDVTAREKFLAAATKRFGADPVSAKDLIEFAEKRKFARPAYGWALAPVHRVERGMYKLPETAEGTVKAPVGRKVAAKTKRAAAASAPRGRRQTETPAISGKVMKLAQKLAAFSRDEVNELWEIVEQRADAKAAN